MTIDRREFLKTTGATIATALTGTASQAEPKLTRKAVNLAAIARSHPYWFEDSATQLARVREYANKAALFGSTASPSLFKAGPEVVSLAQYQSPYQNQELRGTCYAFATCAAMEATYKRKYGVNIKLSEQYAFHLNKAFELLPTYATTPDLNENNSSLWGFQGGSDLVQKLAICAVPDVTAARYLTNEQMISLNTATQLTIDLGAGGKQKAGRGLSTNPDGTVPQERLDTFEFLEGHVPTTARHVARFRIASWESLSSVSTTIIESVLAAGHEVVADVPGHCTLLIGYDRPNRQWLVKNSWGEYQAVYWSYDDPQATILGAHYITDVVAKDAPPQKDAWWIGRWNMDHDGWRGELVIRRTVDFHAPTGSPTKLGNYYRDGRRYDVNGTTMNDGQGLHFWIADTSDHIVPGSPTGQEFRAYVFSADPFNAAGLTTVNGVSYGVSLARKSLPGVTSNVVFQAAGAWLGKWSMNHDGKTGTLSIASASPVTGSYLAQNGRSYAVTGTISTAQPHLMSISIAFPGNLQQFQLACHSREISVFSGTTELNGHTYGAKGVRQSRLLTPNVLR